MNGKISVCLNAYNADKYIAKAIESVLGQTYTNFELFLVNDNSQDSTLGIMKGYKDDPRVKVLDFKDNVGTWAVKNFVLKNYATGDYWAHHDADDYSESNRFERQLGFLNEGLHGCGTAIDEIYQDNIEPRIPSDYKLTVSADGLVHRRNDYPHRVDWEKVSTNINDLPKLKVAMNGSLLFKMDTVKELGGFDGRTRFGADSDFLWRFVCFYKFGNVPEILYHRRFHGTSLTQSKSTGWNSDVRKVYAQKIKENHIKRVEMIKEGQIGKAKELSVEDFYYPPDIKLDIHD